MFKNFREQAKQVLEPVESKADRLTAAFFFVGLAILILAIAVVSSAH